MVTTVTIFSPGSLVIAADGTFYITFVSCFLPNTIIAAIFTTNPRITNGSGE